MSPLAKDFIDKLLVLDPLERYNAAQGLKVSSTTDIAGKNMVQRIAKVKSEVYAKKKKKKKNALLVLQA